MRVGVLCCLLLSAVSGRDRSGEPSAIRVLTGDEAIGKFVNGFRFSLVISERPKCSECQKFKDELEDVAKRLRDARLPFARINIADKANGNVTRHYELNEAPAYTLFREFGKERKTYRGELDKEQFADWITKHSRPAVLWCQSELICRASIVYKHEAGFVGSFKDMDAPGLKIYEKVSENFPITDIMMTAYINENETDEYGTVSIQHPKEMKLITNIVSEEQLEEWLMIESYPLFGPLRPGNFGDYKRKGDNWVIFAAEYDDFEHYGKYFRNAAIEKRDFYNFVWLDSTAYPGFIDRILGIEEYPRVGVVVDGDKRYLMPEKTKITAESIVDFVLSVESGKAIRYVRSEDVPEVEEEAGELRTVVARTFKSKILEAKVPTVLLMVSSTCAHCIAFMPKLADLAFRLRKLDEELKFTKFDAIKNDIPSKHFERTYLPALFLVLPGQEETPKYHNLKNRTEESVLNFLYKYLPQDLTRKIKSTLTNTNETNTKLNDEL